MKFVISRLSPSVLRVLCNYNLLYVIFSVLANARHWCAGSVFFCYWLYSALPYHLQVLWNLNCSMEAVENSQSMIQAAWDWQGVIRRKAAYWHWGNSIFIMQQVIYLCYCLQFKYYGKSMHAYLLHDDPIYRLIIVHSLFCYTLLVWLSIWVGIIAEKVTSWDIVTTELL